MSGATNIAKNTDKCKWVYRVYWIAFDGGGSWNFVNDFARNVVIFVLISSSSHVDNRKANFLALGKGQTYDINGGFTVAEKKFSINFSEAKTKFSFNAPYNGDNSYLFLTGQELYSLKQITKMSFSDSILSRKYM